MLQVCLYLTSSQSLLFLVIWLFVIWGLGIRCVGIAMEVAFLVLHRAARSGKA